MHWKPYLAFFYNFYYRWYRVKYSNAGKLEWGRNLGCDFVMKSCYEWIETRLNRYEVYLSTTFIMLPLNYRKIHAITPVIFFFVVVVDLSWIFLEQKMIFIFQLREYPCNITHDILFLIYNGYF